MSDSKEFFQKKDMYNCIEILASITRKKMKCVHEDLREHSMEHSYSRDWRPADNARTSSLRTLMVHKPPQCPSCHTHSHDEGIDLDEHYNPPIPNYNEEAAKKDMMKSENCVRSMKNSNPEDVDWEERVNKNGWTLQQGKLFTRVAEILDLDRLARLTVDGKAHEPIQRRAIIDKSVGRIRQALAVVSWDTRTVQWLHGLLMDYLPPSYMTSYIDILQTLKSKLPQLVEKMVFGRPTSLTSPEVLGPILKEPWEPIVERKNRKLPNQPIIVVVPSGPNFSIVNSRIQNWYDLFSTMSSVVPISIPTGGSGILKQPISVVTEQIVQMTRAKIQEIRNEAPSRPIILIGFNAGSAVALQVGLVESISCIICLGFSYNTANGVRGTPDDHMMEILTPIQFIIGQNAARSSQEEIESLRERMCAQTSLVVVGSSDDCLRVSKTKRKIEGVTQQMVDNMIADEIAEFATNSLLNPPKPRQLSKDNNNQKTIVLSPNSRKRRVSQGSESDLAAKIQKVSKPQFSKNLLIKTNPDNIVANSQIEFLDEMPKKEVPKIITSYQISSDNAPKMEIRQSAQVVSGIASSPIMLPMLKREGNVVTNTTSVKVGQGNSFIQLKPATIPSAIATGSKIFTIKGVQSSTNKQFITLPTKQVGQRIITNPKPQNLVPTTSNTNFSPQKFTIVRSATKDQAESTDLSNILDMPIVFADNDGVLQESTSVPMKSETTVAANKIITIPKQVNRVTIIDRSDPKFKQLQANLLKVNPSMKLVPSSGIQRPVQGGPQITRVIRVGDTQIKPANTAQFSNIVIKPTAEVVRPKPTILNRNLTVKKITIPAQFNKNK